MGEKIPPRAVKNFQMRLLRWFHAQQRDLPWRRSRSAYRIWVAEVMLQQTRIAAVLPYYRRFLRKFPSVQSLARAPQGEVLRLWSGLGYYRRAKNLQRAAKLIVARHNGHFPRDPDAALRLPGIGGYTAAAVLSIAYGAPLAVLDGNVARVLARLGAVRGDLRAPHRRRKLERIAGELLAREAPGDWNQALMELGETICTPQTPRCSACPVARGCRARLLGITAEIPAPRPKRAAKNMQIAAAILRDPRGRTILVKDPGLHDDVLFSRLWQFPAVEVARNPGRELGEYVHARLGISEARMEPLPAARHGVTFRKITLLPYLAHIARLPRRPRTRVVALDSLGELPVSSATRKLAFAALVSCQPREIRGRIPTGASFFATAQD